MKTPTPLVYVEVSKTVAPDFSVGAVAAWLAREPVHESPFPDWMAASVILPQAVRCLGKITAGAVPIRTSAGVTIGAELGLGFDGFKLACAFVPPEDLSEFQRRLDTAMVRYCPELKELAAAVNGLKSDAETLAAATAFVGDHVNELLAHGAPPIHDYIARLMGVGWRLPPMGDKEP